MDLIWWSGQLLVAGPDTRAFLTRQEPGTLVTGLRLAPGIAPTVLGIPADELRDQRVDLTQVWGPSKTAPWLDRLAIASNPACALESLTVQHIRATQVPPASIRRIVELLAADTAVAGIALELDISERQLHRRSLAAFGYAPKVLARILRFNRALEMARTGIPLAQAAFQAGFADQAHLSRETRSFSGVPISELLRRRSPLDSWA